MNLDKEINSVEIAFAGDFVPNDDTLKYIRADLMQDFAPDVRNLFAKSDLTLVNLETPLTLSTERIIKTGSHFSAHPDNAKLLKHLNIDIVTLSNNHILDYKEQGLMDTVKACKSVGVDAVGVGENLMQASVPLIKEIKGKRIGIINICENEYSIATNHNAGANPFNLVDNFRQLRNLRKEVDILLVVFHGGKEYSHLPLPGYKKACEFFIESGADAVIGHHSHYFSGYTYHQGKPIFYSLGNFYTTSKKDDEALKNSYILKLSFRDNKVEHEIFRTSYCNQSVVVRIESLTADFKVFLDELNETISDSKLLERYWSQRIDKLSLNYINSLLTNNKLVYSIKKRLGIKTFIGLYHLLGIRSFLFCESHLEILKMIVEKKYRKR